MTEVNSSESKANTLSEALNSKTKFIEIIQVPSFLMILGCRSLIGWPSSTSIDLQDTLSLYIQWSKFQVVIIDMLITNLRLNYQIGGR